MCYVQTSRKTDGSREAQKNLKVLNLRTSDPRFDVGVLQHSVAGELCFPIKELFFDSFLVRNAVSDDTFMKRLCGFDSDNQSGRVIRRD